MGWFRSYRGLDTTNLICFEIYKMGMISEAKHGNVKLKKMKKKQLGSDLVVQRSRYHHSEAFFELYKMGIVSAAYVAVLGKT